jgi:transporter family protein
MWLVFAFGSAFFAGLTAILAKIGIKNTNSNLATAIRTIIILLFSWLMVLVVGSQNTLTDISSKTLIFLILSGFATGASWLCYFKALQLGDVNKVTPIDKSSTVMSMLLAILILGEALTFLKVVSMLAIGTGTWLMITKKSMDHQHTAGSRWFIYAALSAIFASLTAILAKIGIQDVESNLGTAIRTIVVLMMAWVVVFVSRSHKDMRKINKRSMLFICLSGITTGMSWLCYYKALQEGEACIVVPIDKLSILVTIAFSWLFLRERLTKKSFMGLLFIVAGTLLLLI